MIGSPSSACYVHHSQKDQTGEREKGRHFVFGSRIPDPESS
jgi:hypothetical protein